MGRMMGTTRRLIVLVLLLAGLTHPGTAQQAAPPQNEHAASPQTQQGQPPPTFRAGINYVAVDVIVTDRRDSPVVDLRKEEFEVFEDGKPQPIEEFRLGKIDATANPGDPVPRRIRSRDDEQAEASREDVRVFAILLDDY